MKSPGCRFDPSRFTSMEYDCELDSLPSCCMSNSSSLSSFDETRYPVRDQAPLVFCIKLPKKKSKDKKCCCCCCCCCCHSRCCCCSCCCNRCCCCNNCCCCCCNCCCKKKKSCCPTGPESDEKPQGCKVSLCRC